MCVGPTFCLRQSALFLLLVCDVEVSSLADAGVRRCWRSGHRCIWSRQSIIHSSLNLSWLFILFFSKIITYVYLNPTRNLNQNQTTAVSTEELFIVFVSILLTWVSVFQALLEGEGGWHEARHGVWGAGGVQEQRVGAAVQDDVSKDVDERLLTHDQEDLWQQEQWHDTAHSWSTLLMQ